MSNNAIANAAVQITGTLAELKAEQPHDLSLVRGVANYAADDLVKLVVGPYRRQLKLDVEKLQARMAERNDLVKAAITRLNNEIQWAVEKKVGWDMVQSQSRSLFALLGLGHKATLTVAPDWSELSKPSGCSVAVKIQLYTGPKSTYSQLDSELSFTLSDLGLARTADVLAIESLRAANATDASFIDRLRREIDKLPEIEREANEAVTLTNLAGDEKALALVDSMRTILKARQQASNLELPPDGEVTSTAEPTTTLRKQPTTRSRGKKS